MSDKSKYPNLERLFDNYATGTELLVTWEGGGVDAYLQAINHGVVTLSGPGTIYVAGAPGGVTLPSGQSIQVKLNEVVATARLA